MDEQHLLLRRLEHNFSMLQSVLQILGDSRLQQKYRGASGARRTAMDMLMWHEASACWKDLILERLPTLGKTLLTEHTTYPSCILINMHTLCACSIMRRSVDSRNGANLGILLTEEEPVSAHQATCGVFASSYIPLWAGVASPDSKKATRCLNSLQASGAAPQGLLIAKSMSLLGQVP